MLPWAKANINPTGQALIISTGTLQLNPQIQRACLQLKEINLLASLNVWKQIMSKRFAERQLNSACSRRHGLLHRGGQEDPLAGEAALVRERPRAPQEHLLPGHRPSPPGLLQAMIGSQAKTRAALRSSHICTPCMLGATIISWPLQSRASR